MRIENIKFKLKLGIDYACGVEGTGKVEVAVKVEGEVEVEREVKGEIEVEAEVEGEVEVEVESGGEVEGEIESAGGAALQTRRINRSRFFIHPS